MTRYILYVEDSADDFQLMLCAFLRCQFTDLLWAESVSRAQDLLNQRDRLPVLVVIDLKLVGRDGLDLLRWIKAQPHLTQLPVYILSASSREEDVAAAKELGAVDYIVKPFGLDQLVGIAQKLIADADKNVSAAPGQLGASYKLAQPGGFLQQISRAFTSQ